MNRYALQEFDKGEIVAKSPTERYPWAWIAHHRLQYGPNWKYVRYNYFPRKELTHEVNYPLFSRWSERRLP